MVERLAAPISPRQRAVEHVYLFIYLFVLIYKPGDHSMRSIVLPWYPGGHVLSKLQGRHLYLQEWHGEGSQKKKT